ncbi:filamentous hemagglutinin N-terminal domain-containing protein [Caballeronia sp. RCC_10]|uniref:two-partner secretion domain-containing protein n=1 Tax=Caballeronia sp. RCC_10 TaxID=3239227 RepID=UPI003524BBDC
MYERSTHSAAAPLLTAFLRCVLGIGACAVSASAYCAGPLPKGGKFIAGVGTLQATANTLEVHQSSPRAVVDWRSFSIGDANRVDIQNGRGSTFGRVSGVQRSVIEGSLNATGSFYLVNPQGVLIRCSGVESVGGRFVASALDIDSTAFMGGGPLTAKGSAQGRVVNLGRIIAKCRVRGILLGHAPTRQKLVVDHRFVLESTKRLSRTGNQPRPQKRENRRHQ